MMAICAFVTSLNVFTGFLLCQCEENNYFYCNTFGIYSIVILFATLCGVFDATLWVFYRII